MEICTGTYSSLQKSEENKAGYFSYKPDLHISLEEIGLIYRDHIWQRKGKPVERRGRKVTDLKGTGLRTQPIPQDGWSASCSLNKTVLIKRSLKESSFGTRSQWCEIDPLDSCTYNIGYQLTQIFAEDLEIINRLTEKYGRDN